MMSPTLTILQGDCAERLRELPDESVQCCVTSPPYWGLRSYLPAGHPLKGHELGSERTPEEYIAKMIAVFGEVRRALKPDGTLWVNIGDSYASSNSQDASSWRPSEGKNAGLANRNGLTVPGLKPKDLVGIPWLLAFALRQPYADWKIKTEAMRAWVAGIVDGEGCITILKTKSSHSESLSFPPIVQVRMSDLEPLQRLVDEVGSSLGKPQHSPSSIAGNQRPSYQWKIVSDRAAEIIEEIYPFLTCKRKQAIVAWNHQKFRLARGNQERKDGDLEKETFCKELINKLNQRELVDLPSWMREPVKTQTPGWYLRQDVIWSKPNCMPESVQDRCTKSHEYIFMLSKEARYFYNAEAIKEPCTESSNQRLAQDIEAQTGSVRANGGRKTNGAMKAVGGKQRGHSRRHDGFNDRWDAMERSEQCQGMRNKRSVWTVAPACYADAHFATFPPDLIRPCILAGSRAGDTVLDPFAGSGTTLAVAIEYARSAIGIELNPEYIPLIEQRTNVTPGLL